jgi:hypothetical protein
MPDPLSLALGSVITAAVGALIRAPGIPAAVRRNDARVVARDRSLVIWTVDPDHDLRRECKALRARSTELVAQGGYEQAARDADDAIAAAKERALWQWRDQATLADNDVAEMVASEGWAHAGRLGRRPMPRLGARDRAAPILDAWRKPTAMNPDRWTYPDDPTKRTLEGALATMPVTGP